MTDPNHIAEARKKVSRPQIREIFLRNGARIEPDRDDLPDWIYEAAFELLELAAPAVQGEPVGWESIDGLPHDPDEDELFWFARSDGYVEGPRRIQPCGYDYDEFELFRPVEPPALYTAPQPAEQQPLPCQECGGDGAGGEHEEDCAMAQPAEQQPAPDVAALVEALDRIANLPLNPCSTENDYRLSAAKAIALAAVSDFRDEALSAHRKQGGDQS